MKARDTVRRPGDLCVQVCKNYRALTLEGKDCTGLDCEDCQLEAQAEISFKAGQKLALEKQGQAYLEGKQEGRKEVAEWIDNERANQNPSVWLSRWQGFKRSRGL